MPAVLSPMRELTERQRDVLRRFLEGERVDAIAQVHHVSVHSIRGDLYAIAERIPSPHPPLRRVAMHGRELL